MSQSQKKAIPESLQLKARNVIQRGTAGIFDVQGDMLDWTLTDSLRAGLEQPGPLTTNWVCYIVVGCPVAITFTAMSAFFKPHAPHAWQEFIFYERAIVCQYQVEA